MHCTALEKKKERKDTHTQQSYTVNNTTFNIYICVCMYVLNMYTCSKIKLKYCNKFTIQQFFKKKEKKRKQYLI